jgi:hypothetical protein
MHPPVVTRDPAAVEAAVQSAFLAMFPRGNKLFIPQAFGWAIDCFTGQWGGYQPIDAHYHDFEHTLQGTLCLARLLRGRHLAKAEPLLSQKMFQLATLAILLHDTGYLKKRGDHEGTGAKFTAIHVRRSADLAAELLAAKRFRANEIKAVQNMILCTGINAPLHEIPFQSELERILGFALGSADLLGQMAAEDYVEKLPVLYGEFAEAARHPHETNSNFALFTSADDLVLKTPAFWEKYVQPKLNGDFGGLHRFLNEPYPEGRNPYVQRIEANMEKLRRHLARDGR